MLNTFYISNPWFLITPSSRYYKNLQQNNQIKSLSSNFSNKSMQIMNYIIETTNNLLSIEIGNFN